MVVVVVVDLVTVSMTMRDSARIDPGTPAPDNIAAHTVSTADIIPLTISVTVDRDEWRKYVHGVANLRI